jgi:hypothetical protein
VAPATGPLLAAPAWRMPGSVVFAMLLDRYQCLTRRFVWFVSGSPLRVRGREGKPWSVSQPAREMPPWRPLRRTRM